MATLLTTRQVAKLVGIHRYKVPVTFAGAYCGRMKKLGRGDKLFSAEAIAAQLSEINSGVVTTEALLSGLLSPEQASEYLGELGTPRTPRTLRHWYRTNIGPPRWKLGQHQASRARYSRLDLREWSEYLASRPMPHQFGQRRSGPNAGAAIFQGHAGGDLPFSLSDEAGQ